MEVFAVLTPTYSGNCKPNLESFLVEKARHAREDCSARPRAPASVLAEQSSASSRLGEPRVKGPELGSSSLSSGRDDRIRGLKTTD